MNLGFSMRHTSYWLGIWQPSDLYIERSVLWFHKILVWKLTNLLVDCCPSFWSHSDSDFPQILSDVPRYFYGLSHFSSCCFCWEGWWFVFVGEHRFASFWKFGAISCENPNSQFFVNEWFHYIEEWLLIACPKEGGLVQGWESVCWGVRLSS